MRHWWWLTKNFCKDEADKVWSKTFCLNVFLPLPLFFSPPLRPPASHQGCPQKSPADDADNNEGDDADNDEDDDEDNDGDGNDDDDDADAVQCGPVFFLAENIHI